MRLSTPQAMALMDAYKYGLHRPSMLQSWTGNGVNMVSSATVNCLSRLGLIELREGRITTTDAGVAQLRKLFDNVP